MNLTEYELLEAAITVQTSITPSVTIFLTIMSGYLVVAWLVGYKLTRAQVWLINALFVGFQIMMIMSWGGRWQFYFRCVEALYSFDPTFYSVTSPGVVLVFGVLMLVSLFGCLKFMWDVRHPKK